MSKRFGYAFAFLIFSAPLALALAAETGGAGPEQALAQKTLSKCKTAQENIAEKIAAGGKADQETTRAITARDAALQITNTVCNFKRVPQDPTSAPRAADAKAACGIYKEVSACFSGIENFREVKGPESKSALATYRDCTSTREKLTEEIAVGSYDRAEDLAGPASIQRLNALDITRAVACSHQPEIGKDAEAKDFESACQWNQAAYNCLNSVRTTARRAIDLSDMQKVEATSRPAAAPAAFDPGPEDSADHSARPAQ